MRRLFHLRTELLPGASALYSAADLRAFDPAAAAAALAKYDGTPERRRLRDTVVPRLERRWTEAVFLSPVHPHAIWRCWRELTGRARPSLEFWSVPAEAVPARAVVLDRTRTSTGEPIDPSEVTPFDVASFRTAFELPAASRAWLAKLAEAGMNGAWFMGIPHVLSPGPVDLSGAAVVDWADPPAGLG